MKIDKLKMYPFNTTLMGVVKGALEYYGIGTSDAILFGGSGHAFLINIHKQICPSGPYVWKYDTFFQLVSNLGIEMVDLGFFDSNSTPQEKNDIEQTIKAYLDKNVPCSLCNMENQLIYGYDNEKLFTALPWPEHPEFPPGTLTFGSWTEFGDKCHANFYVFNKLQRKDDAQIVRQSLRYALELSTHPTKYSFADYAIGPEAYDNWTKAVEQGHGSSHGNWWNATVWSECRSFASRYFSEIADKFHQNISAPALELSKDYMYISDRLALASNRDMAAAEKLEILHELKTKEASALEKIKSILSLF